MMNSRFSSEKLKPRVLPSVPHTSSSLSLSLPSILLLFLPCFWVLCTSRCICGGQRTIFGSQFCCLHLMDTDLSCFCFCTAYLPRFPNSFPCAAHNKHTEVLDHCQRDRSPPDFGFCVYAFMSQYHSLRGSTAHLTSVFLYCVYELVPLCQREPT